MPKRGRFGCAEFRKSLEAYLLDAEHTTRAHAFLVYTSNGRARKLKKVVAIVI